MTAPKAPPIHSGPEMDGPVCGVCGRVRGDGCPGASIDPGCYQIGYERKTTALAKAEAALRVVVGWIDSNAVVAAFRGVTVPGLADARAVLSGAATHALGEARGTASGGEAPSRKNCHECGACLPLVSRCPNSWCKHETSAPPACAKCQCGKTTIPNPTPGVMGFDSVVHRHDACVYAGNLASGPLAGEKERPAACACGEPDDAVHIHEPDMCWRPCRGECGGWVNPTNGLCHRTHPLGTTKIKARRPQGSP